MQLGAWKLKSCHEKYQNGLVAESGDYNKVFQIDVTS